MNPFKALFGSKPEPKPLKKTPSFAQGKPKSDARQVVKKSPSSASATTELASPASFVMNKEPVDYLIPPTRTQVEIILEARSGTYGEVMTLVGGPVPVDQGQRENAILFSKGVLLIAKGEGQRGDIASLKSLVTGPRLAAQRQFEHLITREIPRAAIKDLYTEFESTMGTRKRSDLLIDRTGDIQQRFLKIASEGIRQGASDIHVIKGWRQTPDSVPQTRIEFRIDRLLEQHDVWSYEEGRSLVEAAFNLTDEGSSSKNGISEGAFISARISAAKQKHLDPKAFGLRLQFNSTTGPDHEIVFRILYRQISQKLQSLSDMGFESVHMKLLTEAIRKPNVLNFISGTVNSGKSTTQRAILNELHTAFGERMKISTLESPVEFVMPFAVQHDIRNGDYVSVLEAQLRSDRNVVSIGETRRAEEAEAAFIMVTTGMRGWTTVHAPSAIGALDRCRAWKLDPHFYTNHNYVGALVSQKLLSRPCKHCGVGLAHAKIVDTYHSNEPGTISAGVLAALKSTGWDLSRILLRGTGRIHGHEGSRNPVHFCRKCNGKGYKGAALVAEIIVPDAEFMSHVKAGDLDAASAYWFSKKEFPTLIDHGAAKMLDGKIVPDELEADLGNFIGSHPERTRK